MTECCMIYYSFRPTNVCNEAIQKSLILLKTNWADTHCTMMQCNELFGAVHFQAKPTFVCEKGDQFAIPKAITICLADLSTAVTTFALQ